MNPYESPKQVEAAVLSVASIGTEPVIVVFDFTPDFVLGTLRRYRSISVGHKVLAVTKYLAAILFLFASMLAISRGRTIGGLFLGSCGAYLLFSRPIENWQTRRKLLTSPYVNETVRLEFSDNGMHATSSSQDTKLKWNVFTQMFRFDEGFLLMQGPGQCNWIPNASILGEAGPERLSVLLESKIKKWADRRTRW